MGETKWTEEQLSAINTRGCNLLVAAAAGSGKTAVLVERIIKMLTDNKNPVSIDSLLVVTFTNAAATEMRERIGDAISKELEKNPNSSLLQRQLALLGRASITTMHSFCLDVIKNNFHMIDLDPNFRIGDETECELLKQEIIEELFESRYDEDDDEFLNLVEAYGGGKDDFKLQNIILNLYNFSMSGPNPKKWLNEKAEEFNINKLEDIDKTSWWKIIKESTRIELLGIIKLLEKAKEICEQSEGIEVYIANLDGDLKLAQELSKSLYEGIDSTYNAFSFIKFTTLKRVKKDLVQNIEDQEKVKSLRDESKKKINKLRDDIFIFSPSEILEGIKSCYKPMNKIVEITIDFLERYKAKKREKGILDFNDLEHLCIEILLEDEKPSKIAEAFKEKFKEVLVDEYQDSNNVQETIIDLVSRKNTDSPNVFMVGDVKQSIYRFRQAKPELFLQKYNTYTQDENEDNRKILLYKNFRSRREVIEGVNYIFRLLMSKNVGELDYTEKEALNLGAKYEEISKENSYDIKENDSKDLGAFNSIELHILDKDGEEELNYDYDDSNENTNIEEVEDLTAIQLEARIVAKRIKEIMNSKENKNVVWDKILGKYRNIKFRDIVILLRATKNWSDVFVEELGLYGIPVYADAGTGYFQTIEIKTIMSLLHIIDNPLQDIHMVASLRSPIFGFTPDELGDLRLTNKDNYFYENIKLVLHEENNFDIKRELKDKCKYFFNSLEKWREKVLYMPIDEFIWYLYSDTSYYGYVGAMPNGVQRQANLRILFQRAKQFEQISFKGIFNFINFINKLRNSSGDMGSAKIISENEDVVRIMSIHKSKGLEFPIVFLSGTGKNFNLMDLNNDILIHEELGFGPDCVDVNRRISYKTLAKNAIKKKCKLETLSEEMRILYVAFTRAKEKLIITGAKGKVDKVFEKWCSAASLDDDVILSSEVLKGKSFLDWIGMALAKHNHGEEIRNRVNFNINYLKDELSTWEIKMWKKSDLSVDEITEIVDKSEEDLFINKEEVTEEEIIRRLNFQYKFNESTILPSNISVSDLKLKNYEEDNDNTINIFREEIIKKPKFLSEEKGLSSSEKGTIIHFVMQHLDLNRISNVKEIRSQIKEMIEVELLTEKQAEVVYVPRILSFFNSDLGKRMLRSYNEENMIKREFPFFTEISAMKVNPNLPKELYEDEKIRLQGIIDCFFEEDGELVLLDYKTDYVEEGKSHEIKDKYDIQLKYYSETLEKITGKKVKDKYLYLFYTGEILKY